ncbi:alpha/beta hydrolase [Actinomycetospora lemnae]|uniref:Alpha/beta hydrolase n=1 Tax=Actinomycetospora lemnae TaxID=3019891 RepID=A0ABT5STY1_9PSEU|nr:alpha/beta hydrolase [Actinomycetospora sp. DW7H6]MDD7965626.1 alpha/beta hydrolase [Actinomycetospora sp. DW7H6]
MAETTDRIDPELATAVATLTADGLLPMTRDDVGDARRNYRTLALRRRGDPPSVGSVHDDVAPAGGTGTDADVAVRVYEPAGEQAAITVVWLHGGGWVLGDLDTADGAARRVCTHLGATVVSVDYRLAPEHPHPAPLTDAHTAMRWAALQRASDRLVVGGDSAGAGLAAGAALLARDWGPRLDAQLLLYPGLDPTMASPSVAENADGPFLTRADLVWFWERYVPDAALRDDPSVAPLRAAAEPGGLDGVAPAVVATAELDPLRDEGRAYADALEAAGVAVRRLDGAGLVHGFFGLAAASAAARAEGDRALDALGELLAT